MVNVGKIDVTSVGNPADPLTRCGLGEGEESLIFSLTELFRVFHV